MFINSGWRSHIMKDRLKEKKEVCCLPTWRDPEDTMENERQETEEKLDITYVKGDKILCVISATKSV